MMYKLKRNVNIHRGILTLETIHKYTNIHKEAFDENSPLFIIIKRMMVYKIHLFLAKMLKSAPFPKLLL